MDRQIDLKSFPKEFIVEQGYEFLLDDDYIVPEALVLASNEIDALIAAQTEVYQIFEQELEHLIQTGDFKFLGLPNEMIDLIVHSFQEQHMHLIGRFDFAGGIDSSPIKLLEFNADTPTMIPESSIIQKAFLDHQSGYQQFNDLSQNIELAFKLLKINEPDRHLSVLGTSLGHQEDAANAKILLDGAGKQGFYTAYADLPEVGFLKNEGVFLETPGGEEIRFDYLLKVVPWEFICFEEPGLLNILHNLILQDLVYVMNPAHALVYQSKVFLDHVSQKYSIDSLLKSSRRASDFNGQKFVEKVSFGRLGENISIFDERGQIIEKTGGPFGRFDKIYQEFTDLYRDDSGDYYQLGLYNVNGHASGISFRRGESLIIDDDCQFIPHYKTS